MSGSKYAAATKVTIGQSRDELERVLNRYGATHFMYGTSPQSWVVAFQFAGRNYKMILDRPWPGDYTTDRQVEQAERSRWRALILVIKGKFEAIELGIESFETAFLSNLMLPDGQSVGEWIEPQIDTLVAAGEMPPLLAGMLPRQLGDGR